MRINQDSRYYFFSFSNFIAALGGGMILGKGVGVIDHPYLQGGSVLAFFVGTTLGLLLLQNIPKKISSIIARSFSFFAAMIALILLYIFKNYSVNEKIVGMLAIIFFVLLSLRFGFWFYSRVLRASLTAGQQQKIAWVELGYYAGMIGGLILWSFLGIEVGLATALMMDAVFQLIAGMIDILAGNSSASFQSVENKPSNSTKFALSRHLISSIVFLTIGIQVVIFSLAHYVSPEFTPLIIASYYSGAALGALFCKKLQISLNWDSTKMSFAKIFVFPHKNGRGVSFVIHGILSSLCVAIAIVAIIDWQWALINPIFLLFIIFIAAFFYEILALAILDRIGFEERAAQSNHGLMHAYGLMGIGAAVSLWLLTLSNNSSASLFATLFVCVIFSMYFIRRKVAT